MLSAPCKRGRSRASKLLRNICRRACPPNTFSTIAARRRRVLLGLIIKDCCHGLTLDGVGGYNQENGGDKLVTPCLGELKMETDLISTHEVRVYLAMRNNKG